MIAGNKVFVIRDVNEEDECGEAAAAEVMDEDDDERLMVAGEKDEEPSELPKPDVGVPLLFVALDRLLDVPSLMIVEGSGDEEEIDANDGVLLLFVLEELLLQLFDICNDSTVITSFRCCC